MQLTPERIGRFRIERYLASGGMADVYLARLEGPGGFTRRCVVKRISTPFVEDDEFRRLFELEARVAAQLHHPNIVQVFEYGEDEGYPFMAMEYIDGLSVRSAMRLLKRRGQTFPAAVAARFFTQICEGLYFAHTFRTPEGAPAGVIHRDISPDNMLLDRLGNCRLADFGIARSSAGPKTQTGMLKGKLAYLAPEVVRGVKASVASDLYACGVSLFEVLAGRRPFTGENELELALAITERTAPPLSSLRADVPPGLETVVQTALRRDPTQRFHDARALSAAIERAVAGEPPIDRGWLEAWTIGLADEAQVVAGKGVLTPRTTPDGAGAFPPTPAPEVVVIEPAATISDDDGAGGRQDIVETGRPTVATGPPRRFRGAMLAVIGIAFAVGLFITWRTQRESTQEEHDPPVVVATKLMPDERRDEAMLDAGTPSSAAADVVRTAALEPDSGLTPSTQVAIVEAPREEPAPRDAGRVVRSKPLPAPAQPSFSSLTIRTDPWTEVRLDGEALGPTPVLDRRVSVGKHVVELRNPVFGIVRKQPITVPAAGSTLAIAFPMGELRVRGADGTRVFLAGQLLGTTPFRAPLPVAAGSHAVRLTGPQGDKALRVTVTAGGTAELVAP